MDIVEIIRVRYPLAFVEHTRSIDSHRRLNYNVGADHVVRNALHAGRS